MLNHLYRRLDNAAPKTFTKPLTGSFLAGRRLALPSWVIPGSIQENINFLTGRTDEIGLLFFETASSLAYAKEDLPYAGKHMPALEDCSAHPLSFHVHLPLDLPMHNPEEAARIAAILLEKIAYLGDVRAVLHPSLGKEVTARQRYTQPIGNYTKSININPTHILMQEQMAKFFDACQNYNILPQQFIIENIEGNNLLSLLPLCADYDLRFCLDLGHLIAYSQYDILESEEILQRTDMLHLSAPGTGASKRRHLPLTKLRANPFIDEREIACSLVRTVPKAIIMLELFSMADIETSLPLVQAWLQQDR